MFCLPPILLMPAMTLVVTLASGTFQKWNALLKMVRRPIGPIDVAAQHENQKSRRSLHF